MVLGFDPHQVFRLGERVKPGLHLERRAELIVGALDEDAGDGALAEWAVFGWESNCDQAGCDAGFAAELQDDSRAEREARQGTGQMGILLVRLGNRLEVRLRTRRR